MTRDQARDQVSIPKEVIELLQLIIPCNDRSTRIRYFVKGLVNDPKAMRDGWARLAAHCDREPGFAADYVLFAAMLEEDWRAHTISPRTRARKATRGELEEEVRHVDAACQGALKSLSARTAALETYFAATSAATMHRLGLGTINVLLSERLAEELRQRKPLSALVALVSNERFTNLDLATRDLIAALSAYRTALDAARRNTYRALMPTRVAAANAKATFVGRSLAWYLWTRAVPGGHDDKLVADTVTAVAADNSGACDRKWAAKRRSELFSMLRKQKLLTDT